MSGFQRPRGSKWGVGIFFQGQRSLKLFVMVAIWWDYIILQEQNYNGGLATCQPAHCRRSRQTACPQLPRSHHRPRGGTQAKGGGIAVGAGDPLWASSSLRITPCARSATSTPSTVCCAATRSVGCSSARLASRTQCSGWWSTSAPTASPNPSSQ
jgi:hypothetical protein